MATFKENDFKIMTNRKKISPLSQIHDTNAFDTKDNEISKKVLDNSPKIFVFKDSESSEDFTKNDENMKKTANFTPNDIHVSMKPLDYKGVFDSDFDSSNTTNALAQGGRNFSPLSKARRNLNEVTVKSWRGF
jgi:hypothetical protein